MVSALCRLNTMVLDKREKFWIKRRGAMLLLTFIVYLSFGEELSTFVLGLNGLNPIAANFVVFSGLYYMIYVGVCYLYD